MRGCKWSPGECETVARYYRKYPVSLVANMLGRTPASVRNMAAQMGIGRDTHKPWTEVEHNTLRASYAKAGAYLTAARLGRTPESVMRRACDLGISGRKTNLREIRLSQST